MPIRTQKKRSRAGYMISAVSELYNLHPQTLRLYERVGLLKPSRSERQHSTLYRCGSRTAGSDSYAYP